MAKRVLAIVFGVLLLIAGAVIAVGSGVLMAAFGRDGALTSAPERLSTPTTALVAALDNVKGTSGVAADAGAPTLRLSVTGTAHPVFIGIGPAAAVDRYLAGSQLDRVTELEVDPFKLKTVRQNGAATPGRPQSQTFWTARASGSGAALSWKVSDGSYRLVVMNADATPGVQADGRFTLTVAHLFGIGLGILIGGLVLCLLGALLVLVGIRMRVDSRRWPDQPARAPGTAAVPPRP
jgi:hypothetical protein